MTRFKSLAMVGLATMALASCANLPKLNTGDGQTVRVAVDAYNVVERAATTYGNLPECLAGQTYLKNFCASRSVVKKVITYGRVANEARNQLVSFARSNPNSTATGSYISALTASVVVLKSALINEGVVVK